MSVRDLDVAVLRDAVARLLVESNYNIPPDILEALRGAIRREQSPLGRRTLGQIVRNYEVAAAGRLPVCQDSGLAVVMLETGQDVHWDGASCSRRLTTAFAKAPAPVTCGGRSPAIRRGG